LSAVTYHVGFPKGDYAPREGRKGRVIKDDPKRYPDKENKGFFIGATGGWAGGEAGLWKLREEVKVCTGDQDMKEVVTQR
jgi:hypothetical protein